MTREAWQAERPSGVQDLGDLGDLDGPPRPLVAGSPVAMRDLDDLDTPDSLDDLEGGPARLPLFLDVCFLATLIGWRRRRALYLFRSLKIAKKEGSRWVVARDAFRENCPEGYRELLRRHLEGDLPELEPPRPRRATPRPPAAAPAAPVAVPSAPPTVRSAGVPVAA